MKYLKPILNNKCLTLLVLISAALVVLPLFASRAKSPEDSLRSGFTKDKSSSLAHESKPASPAGAYGVLPLSFEANQGQTDPRVKFLARGQGYGLFLTANGALLSLHRGATQTANQEAQAKAESPRSGQQAVLSLRLEGARPASRVEGIDELTGKVNYFLGSDPSKWRTDVATFAKVSYRNVYRDIDVIYYGNQGQLEYDFVVGPGADPRLIKLSFAGNSSISVDRNGDLVLGTQAGDVHQRKPHAYQEINSQRREIEAAYKMKGNRVGFEIGTYDKHLPLVIDPVLAYSTFLGGASAEQGLGIAVDSQGSAYLTGSTSSTDFPLAGPFQSIKDFGNDAFVVKLNPAGTALIYSTFLGGNGDDIGNAIAVDGQGSAYVVGLTGSGGFPRTGGVFQDAKDGSIDGFVTKLSSSGSSLVYSTFLGGDNFDSANSVAVGAGGNAYVVGRTDSTRFRFFIPLARNGSPAYKTTDGAGHWSPSAAELTASAVNAFAIEPGNSNIVYAGSTIGVFKSTDAGAHWNLTGTGSSSTSPLSTNAIVVNPSNSNIIYAGASNGVFKSTNGGAQYDAKNTGFLIPSINALAIVPNTPTTLYAGTLLGIYKSTNGGDTWAEVKNGIIGASPRVNEVVIDPTNPAIIYMGTNRGMFKSTNGGDLWTLINTGALGTGITPQITALTIDPLNPLTLYAGGFNGTDILFKTTDGGVSWTASGSGLSFNAINVLAIDPVTPSTLYAATTNTAIYKSTNGGASWSQSNTGLANATTTAVVVDQNNPSVVYAGTTIGADAFAVKLNPVGSATEYLLNFGGNENDEARGVALDVDGNAYIAGITNSSNFPLQNAFQSTVGGLSDAFVTKLNASGTGILYSTYLGGNRSDQGAAIAVRGTNAYVTGLTNSPNFPLANPFKSTLIEDTDAFVTKLNSTGSALDFSSYLGGSFPDQGFGIAVDAHGGVFVTGVTFSSDFPSIAAPQPGSGGGSDAFLTKIIASGTSIVYSTYLGGVGSDQGNGVAVDTLGNAYVIGNTSSANFPTVNPLQPTLRSTDAFVTKLAPAADLAVTMTDAPDPVAFGNDLTYTISVKNNGELTATGVVLADTLPAGASFISATPSKGTCTGSGPVNCAIGGLNVDEVATVTIVVKPPAVRTINNTATVTANEPDANTANNTATVTTTVDFADMSIVKTVAQARTAPGARLTYLLRVTNQSGTGAQNITVTDVLPASLAFVSCSVGGGVCSASGNTVTATFPALAVGSSQMIVINAAVSAGVLPGTQINNTANVSGSPGDPQPLNNSATHSITVAVSSVVPTVNGKIAFASDRNFTPVAEPTGVYLINSDGSGEHLFPNIPRNAGRPTWSPDGTRLAFQTAFAEPGEIDVINVDGTGRIKVADNAVAQTFLTRGISWSPSGTQIAYVGRVAQFGPFSIFVAGADGTGLVPLPGSPTGISDLAWSPDGSKFLYVATNHIFVIGVDGNNQQQLTVTEQTSDGPTFDWSPRWSPDGSKVLFMRSTTNSYKLFTMNPDGSGQSQILSTGATDGSWSPDGTKIVYAVQNELYQSNLDGSNTQRLTNNIYYDYLPDWQPVLVNTVQFANAVQSAGEGDGRAIVLVTRTGDTSAPATVDFITVDGSASQRTDYTLAAGTVRFAAGETSKNISVLLNDDTYIENAESFSITLSNVEGAQMGSANVATISISDNDSDPNVPNPIDGAQFFVRQHYSDFLSRVPDQSGLDYWTSQITQCGADPSCVHNKRVDVSNAFFYEQEYQQTSAYVYRLYRAAYGNNQPSPNPFPNSQYPNEEKKLPSYQVFARDRARVRGGASLAQLQLDLANAFALRPEFIAKYPASVDRSAFVDAVLATIRNDIGVDMTSIPQRATLITAFDHGGRGEVLYRLADDNAQSNPFNNRAFIDAEYNRAFVVTQYFGYLRRNPDIPGFVFWLGQVNGAPLRDVSRQHAMVCSFITSTEYQQRFSPLVTRSNADCQ